MRRDQGKRPREDEADKNDESGKRSTANNDDESRRTSSSYVYSRSYKAQELHTALCEYIKFQGDERALFLLNVSLRQMDQNALMECSINGFSVLHDAVRLPYKFDEARQFAPLIQDRLCDDLYHSVITACRLNQFNRALAQLLLSVRNDGVSILHDILVRSSKVTVERYFADLFIAVRTGLISKERLQRFLFHDYYHHFTLFHFAIMSASVTVIESFSRFMNYALDSGYIDRRDFEQCFQGTTNSKISPMHLAANKGNLRIVESVYHTLELIFGRDTEKFAKILHALNSHGEVASCKNPHPDQDAINDFLSENRRKYPIEAARERKTKQSKTTGFFHQSNTDEQDADNLLLACISSDYKTAKDIIQNNPRAMLISGQQYDIGGEAILMSPVTYVYSNGDKYIRELFESCAPRFLDEYLEQANQATDRTHEQEIINKLAEYQHLYEKYQNWDLDVTEEDIKHCWIDTIGMMQAKQMHSHVLREFCDNNNSRNCRWRKTSSFNHPQPPDVSMKYIMERNGGKLGKNYAFYRGADGVLNIDSYKHDVTEMIVTFKRYCAVRKEQKEDSLEKLRQKQRKINNRMHY